MTQPKQPETSTGAEMFAAFLILAIFGGVLTFLWFATAHKPKQPAWDQPVEKGAAICFVVGKMGDYQDRLIWKCPLAKHSCYMAMTPDGAVEGLGCGEDGMPPLTEEGKS